MNFTSPSDFLYVTGEDLYEIKIDNEIMPIRDQETKKHIRGMDIAFLYESIEERCRACGLEPKTMEYTNTLSLGQINKIIDRYNELISGDYQTFDDDYYFIKDDLSNLLSGSNPLIDKPIDTIRYQFEQVPYISSQVLLADAISNLYENIGKMNIIARNQNGFDQICCQLALPQVVVEYTDPKLPESEKQRLIQNLKDNTVLWASHTSYLNNNFTFKAQSTRQITGTPYISNDIKVGPNEMFESFNSGGKSLLTLVYTMYRSSSEQPLILEEHTLFFAPQSDERTSDGKVRINTTDINRARNNLLQAFGYYPENVCYSDYGIKFSYPLTPVYNLRDRTIWAKSNLTTQ